MLKLSVFNFYSKLS